MIGDKLSPEKGGKTMLLTENTSDFESKKSPDGSKKTQGRKKQPDTVFFLGITLLLFAASVATAMVTLSLRDSEISDTASFTTATQPPTESAKKVFLKKLSKKVPYLGMYEEYISKTSLGKPKKEVIRKETADGTPYKIKVYRFKKKGKLIFTAKCYDGEVFETWDYRNLDAPYIGMPVEGIESTALGKPLKKVRHKKRKRNGSTYTLDCYDFKKKGKKIFTACCAFGVVEKIVDYRKVKDVDYEEIIEQKHSESKIYITTTTRRRSYISGEDVTPPRNYSPKKTTRPPATTKKKKPSRYEDYFNVEDYDDAEDFYYDYMDDFYDYYDAEDYFNNHN